MSIITNLDLIYVSRYPIPMQNFNNQNKNVHPDDKRNLIIFMIAVFVMFAVYDVFVKQPHIDTLRQQQTQNEQLAQEPQATQEPATPQILTRDEALTQAQRIQIETPTMSGSLSTKGGRIDDIILKDYYKTVDREENVTLLNPANVQDGLYGEFGWLASGGISVPTANTVWTVESGSTLTPETPITLSWDNGAGLTFRKTISVDADHMFDVTMMVQNNGTETVSIFPYGLTAQKGIPSTLENRALVHEGPIGYYDGDLEEMSFKDLSKDVKQEQIATGGWIGFTQKYWFVGLLPQQDQQTKFRFLAQPGQGPDGQDRTHFQADILGPQMTIQPGTQSAYDVRFFAGPKKVRMLDRYEKALDLPHFDLVVDFGMFYFLTKPFFYVLTWISHSVGSFAIGLLLFTVLLRALMFPLANKSYRSFAKMKIIGPKMKELQERHGSDRQAMQKALFELYQKEDVNPAAGCFPLLLQIPIFFALYKVLFVTIEMRHTPFFGWINDMSAPDPTTLFNLFGTIPWDPPSFLMIGAWPCIMCCTLLLQQRLTPMPQDPMQNQIMLMMPFVMTFILSGFPAGLVIYWTWSNTLSIIQQIIIMKSVGAEIHLFKFITGRKENPPSDEVIESMAEEVEEDKTEEPVKVTPPKPKRSKKKK